MRRGIVALALFASGFQSVLAEPTGDLKKFCDMVCGGVWRQSNSDGVIEQRFVWDDAAGVVRGQIHGVDALDTLWLVGLDTQKKTLWMVQTVAGDLPSIGGLKLTDDGFFYSVTLHGTEAYFASEVSFTDTNTYTYTFMGTTPEGFHAQGGGGPYVRTPE